MSEPKHPISTRLIKSSLTLLSILIAPSCFDSKSGETSLAEECVETDLMAQCPVGTLPLLEADVETSCSEDGSVDVDGAPSSSDSSREVDQVCAGSGSCRIVCALQNPCMYGIERLSREEVVCAKRSVVREFHSALEIKFRAAE